MATDADLIADQLQDIGIAAGTCNPPGGQPVVMIGLADGQKLIEWALDERTPGDTTRIVQQLAGEDPVVDDMCGLCETSFDDDSGGGDRPGNHDPSCSWRRACEWVNSR